MPKIAVVMPVFNEADAIAKNFRTLHRILIESGIEAEYMLVDDGSRDGTWPEIRALCAEFPAVRAIKFSRNFGKELALRAGLDHIDADIYVTLDSDLQHPPEHVAPMIALLESSGASIVNGVKSSRGRESLLYKFLVKSFYRLLRATAGIELDNNSDFKVLRREVVDRLRSLTERNIFYRGVVDWVGFDAVSYPFEVAGRKIGKTKFNFPRLFSFAIGAIVSYTSKPLLLTMVFGVLFALFAFVLGIHTLVNFFSGNAISGFSTVILLQLITGALIMISLGLIGIYIAKIYDEVKGRPPYIVEEVL